MNNNLVVSEKFYSIQGEGQTMGVPAVFLRLGGCNLLCKGKGWVCDSIEVWKKGVNTPFDEVLSEYIERLRNGAHLVITGGEPLLHRSQLGKYLIWFQSEYGFKPIIEIETNGTISPTELLESLVDYWNVSPKLSTSGESKVRRINELALIRLSSFKNAIFKFVISENEDFLEILEDFGEFIHMDKVVLMPAGENQEQLNKTRQMVADLCVDVGVKYSERLHIVIWNQKTGV
jgi:7-carboxy-7-deazaguanine synthase